jgi:hypothetical protein
MPKSNPLRDDQRRFEAVLKEAALLRWRKLNDYGASYRTFGPLGVIVRMGDKMRRIENLFQKSEVSKVKDESVRDTLVDLLNYAAMGIILLDENRRNGK